jgi:hypothetical protein
VGIDLRIKAKALDMRLVAAQIETAAHLRHASLRCPAAQLIQRRRQVRHACQFGWERRDAARAAFGQHPPNALALVANPLAVRRCE